uniref:Reverse transcriptase Ty1/copia-type domain-containing protein n=1 Tax=Tanacetum cinerariifolium TaxID=118510 RepID=A0A6L2JER4_TANCI|nr:hypothetical protein [Tanacetum cinerariifolium]
MEKERDDLKLTLEKFQTSSKNLSKLLESQVSDKIDLGFDSQVFNSQVFDCEEFHSHESDDSVPKSPVNDSYKTSEGYHAIHPPYTGTFMPSKPDLVFNDTPTASESIAHVINVESCSNKPSKDMSKTLRLDASIIEDWISDSEDETEIESVPKQKGPSFVRTFEHVKTPRESVKKVEHPKQAENFRTTHQKSRGKVKRETVSAQQYVLLPLWSTGSQDPQNTDADVADAAFDVKENENDVHVFANGSQKSDSKKHDEKAKRDAKGKSLVGSPTRVKDLRAKFKEISFNNTNRVDAVNAPVNAIGPNPTNSINSFNTASPSNTSVSPNFRIARKSSFVDPFKYPDDPDMPKLEDIVYSDDEEDMDVKSAFLYGTIKEEVYVYQPLGFKDIDYSDKVYKVFKAFYELHQAPRAWITSKAKNNGIFISQDKYVAKILRKFDFTDVKSASTLVETEKPLLKDPDGEDVDVHIYSEELASPKQTNLGKDYSNPFMAGVNTPRCDEDSLELIELMVFMYALVVNPAIYISCIKQLWATATIKKVNDVVQLCALIDGKKVIVTEDVIKRDLRLDDADGVECLPNEESFVELARMGYEKPHRKMTFYKAFFSAQWKFLIHTLVQRRKFNFSKYISDNMVRNVDSLSKFLMYLRFLQVAINNQVDDLISHTTSYTSPALTQKEQPSLPHESSMSLLNTLMETCASLSKKVAELEQDKNTQALEILKLKKRIKKLEKKKRSKSSGFRRLRKIGGKIKAIDADEDVTLVDVKTQDEEVAAMDDVPQGRIDQEDFNATNKGVNAAEPTIFDDEEVTMTMAQTLITLKAEKAKLLDEQMSQRLHDEEVKKAAAREKQEKG